MPMIDQGEGDNEVIAVCADDPEYKYYNDIKELHPHRLAEIRRFFDDSLFNKKKKKKNKVQSVKGVKESIRVGRGEEGSKECDMVKLQQTWKTDTDRMIRIQVHDNPSLLQKSR